MLTHANSKEFFFQIYPTDFRHNLSMTPSRNEMAGKFGRSSRKKGKKFRGERLEKGEKLNEIIISNHILT